MSQSVPKFLKPILKSVVPTHWRNELRLKSYRFATKYSYLPHPPLTDDQAITAKPIFVLSAGRSGTNWLANALGLSSKLIVHHEPFPRLFRQANRSHNFDIDKQKEMHEIIRASRDNLIADSISVNRTYVETNNRLTFLVRAIDQAYPNSHFILLHRHPGDFVRSGVRRGYYKSSNYDQSRIQHANADTWSKLSQIEKISWLWNETYGFAESFLAEIPTHRYMRLSCEEMWGNASKVDEVFQFIGVESASQQQLASIQKVRVNSEERGAFPRYSEWSQDQKLALQSQCPMAKTYDYTL